MINNLDKKKTLGQVFTSEKVAYLMSVLLLGKKNNGTILDPCSGGNIFFRTIQKIYRKNEFKFQAVEIDKSVVDVNFFAHRSRKLFIGDFFSYPDSNKFDYVIVNPPYIRQEDLKGSNVNSKQNIKEIVGEDFGSQANLYTYFVAKAGKHLRRGGKMVVICYDSWLYTKYGNEFKKYLQNNFSINKIIHIKKSAFSGVHIGATVIELEDSPSRKKFDSNFFSIDDFNELPDILTPDILDSYIDILKNSNQKEFKKKLIKKIPSQKLDRKFHNIRRGIETPGNGLFYVRGKASSPCYRDIIKDVKSVSGYSVNKSSAIKVLMIDSRCKNEINASVLKHLENIRDGALNNKEGKYLALRKKIKNGDKNWFTVREIKPGSIIFNYYFRENINFFLNPRKILASNNFYILDSSDPYFDLAILNSSFVRRSILEKARNQGSGLKKLQIYEFKQIIIPDEKFISSSNKEKLRLLGKKLSNAKKNNGKEIIKKIDQIIDIKG